MNGGEGGREGSRGVRHRRRRREIVKNYRADIAETDRGRIYGSKGDIVKERAGKGGEKDIENQQGNGIDKEGEFQIDKINQQ